MVSRENLRKINNEKYTQRIEDMAVKVSAAQVKELRDLTGAGPLDCKKALEENDGDVQKAAAALRELAKQRGIKISGKSRTMNESQRLHQITATQFTVTNYPDKHCYLVGYLVGYLIGLDICQHSGGKCRGIKHVSKRDGVHHRRHHSNIICRYASDTAAC